MWRIMAAHDIYLTSLLLNLLTNLHNRTVKLADLNFYFEL